MENKEQILGIIPKLTLSAENVPLKIEYSVEGEWQKLSYIAEGTIFKGKVHEDTVAYGITIWIRNVPDNQLSPVTVSVHDYVYSPSNSEEWGATVAVACIAIIIVATLMTGGWAGVSLPSFIAGQYSLILLNAAR